MADRRDKVLPALVATVFCGSMAMMAFVALVGPIARVAGLQPWQAGLAVTASGVMWMLGARPWGLASDRYGRRAVLLAGAVGFTLAYWLLCAAIAATVAGWLAMPAAFLALVVARALVGGAYAAIPAASGALIADRVPPAGRAAAMATLGTGSGAGLVVGPALAAALAPYGLSVPLLVTAALPPVAVAVLWWVLPRGLARPQPPRRALALSDPRIRLPLCVGFASMVSVSVAQVTIGFYALDRLALPPEAAATAAGTALTAVGVALVASQAAATRVRLAPEAMIGAGTLVAALGFGSASLASDASLLAVSYFVAALGMGWVFPAFPALAANGVGPVLGSLLYTFGPQLPYVAIGLLLACASATMWHRFVTRPLAQAPQGGRLDVPRP